MLDSKRASTSHFPLNQCSLQLKSLDHIEGESSSERKQKLLKGTCQHRINTLRRLEMVSKERKRAILHEQLQLLRSITNSHAVKPQTDSSIIIDASKYIEELKKKIEQLNQELENSQNPLPMVHVEAVMNGYQVNVYSEDSCPGLLVYVLEVFEELGLIVLEARASCSKYFHLEAVGGEQNNQQYGEMDAIKVKHATLRAIENWRQTSQQD